MQHLHDSQAGIQPDEIGQLERAHGNIRAVLHDSIDRVPIAHSRLETDNRLIDVRHQDPVGQEAGGIRTDGGDLAETLAEGNGGLEGLGASLETRDDLHALLNGDGVHEVGGHHTRRVGGVIGVFCGRCGDAGDGDGGGVGG